MSWLSAISAIGPALAALFKWLSDKLLGDHLKTHEDLGKMKAEKEGMENAQDIIDALDRADANRLPTSKGEAKE